MTPGKRLLVVLLLAAVYAACYSAIKAGLAYAPPLRFAGLRAVLGGLPLLLVSAVVERGAVVVWSGTFLSLFLFLTLAGTSAATALWFWLVQDDDVGRLTLQLFLVPVFGLVLATALFREPIGTMEAAGIVIVILGISLVVRGSSRRAEVNGGTAHPTRLPGAS